MVVVMHEPSPEMGKEPMLANPSPQENNGDFNFKPYAYNRTTSTVQTLPFDIKDLKTALDLLNLASSRGDKVLFQKCIECLDNLLNVQNVLRIYSGLRNCLVSRGENFEPSAPPITEGSRQLDLEWARRLISDLRHNCLLEIDRDADSILQKEELLELSYPDILGILERDTLEVSTEALVYRTIYKWTQVECKRRSMDFKEVRLRREILQNLIHAPRYGLMSKKEFNSKTLLGIEGPRYSGILDEKEWRLIKFFIKEKDKGRPVHPLEYKMSEPRILGKDKPFDLSPRSRNIRRNENDLRRGNASSGDCDRKTFFEKCLVNLLTCWSVIFD